MYFNKLKNNHGVTLIELVIALAIVSLISLMAYSFFSYENKIFYAGSNQSEIQSDVRTTIGYMSKEIKYATELTIRGSLSDFTEISDSTFDKKDFSYIYLYDGSLVQRTYTDATNYTERKFSSNLISSGSFFKRMRDDAINITLTSQKDSKDYQVDSTIILDNFILQKPAKIILDGPTGQAIKVSFKEPVFSIPAIFVTSIDITSPSTTITTDKGTLSLNVTINPTDATNKDVTWSVNDSSLASVDSTGTVRALKNGSVVVTATAKDGSGISDSITIDLSNQVEITVPVTSVTLDGDEGASTITIKNDTLQMIAIVEPSNATNKNVTWSVNLTALATIDSLTGELTAISDGTVIVKATAIDGSGIFGTKLIVISNQIDLGISNIPSNPTVQKGTTYNFIPQGTGGAAPYAYTYSNFAGWASTPITINGNEFIGAAPNGNGKSMTFDVTVTDNAGKSRVYHITVKTV